MKNDDDFELVKEWRALVSGERDNAFAMAQYARRVRKRHPAGSVGDQDFKVWCCVKLKQSGNEAELMLTWAIAGTVFKDSVELSAAGGRRGVEALWGVGSWEKQEAIMQSAKNGSYTMQYALSQYNKVNAGPAHVPMRTPVQDARQLARYLAKNADKLPPAVREIVARYVSLDNERARA